MGQVGTFRAKYSAPLQVQRADSAYFYYYNVLDQRGEAIIERPSLVYVDRKYDRSISRRMLRRRMALSNAKHLCIQGLCEFDPLSISESMRFLDEVLRGA